ncbi:MULTISPECIES: CU044_2847 family protein [Streptomyces]|uniref:CU044_2847 family protein n=1 Tax=Streptomyces TaxID=1883 RepID=UPI000AC53D01|nr:MULTISPECIES: CU044_2847 family protein [Streptomyces]
MAELLRISMGEEDGEGQLVVEVEDDEPGMVRASRVGDRMREASVSLEEALAPIRRAAETTLRTFQAAQPTTVELEFGVKLNASAGAVLTKAGVEGHIVVKLGWQKKDPGA